MGRGYTGCIPILRLRGNMDSRSETRRGLLQASPTYRNLKQGVSQIIKSVEIYFRDLTSEAQANLLDEFETKEEDENWDVFPIAVIDREIEES